jgi:hypothetical protein
MRSRLLGVTAATLGMIALLPIAVSTSSAQTPSGKIGPDRLRTLILTTDQARAVLPVTTYPFEMADLRCLVTTAAEMHGFGSTSGCAVVPVPHEVKGHDEYPLSVSVLSFTNSKAAKKWLADQRNKYQPAHGQKVFDASPTGFAVHDTFDPTYKVTSVLRVKGSSLVTSLCLGRVNSARLACAKALTTAQANKLP